MATYEVRAHNWATQSENKIHDDAVARRYGFGGGLVPGVAVFAYMTHPAAERWGRDWVGRGSIATRFGSPVYEGETVTVSMGDDGALRVANPQGLECATGTAAQSHAVPKPDPAEYPEAPLPGSRSPADEESLAEGTVLGNVDGHFLADKAPEYLAQIGETLALYTDEGIAHPGWLLLSANTILAANVLLGPWIHVSSDVSMFAAVTDGQLVSTRARVARLFERKGHRFVTLDVLMLADGEPAMRVEHTAIYKVRDPE